MNALQHSYRLRLTKREKEILDCIAIGMRTSTIAEQLGLSVNTIANHRKNIIKKRGGMSTRQILKGI